MGIEGNDGADELAKEATELEPITEVTTIAKLHRQIHERLKKEWISEWARKPMTGRYAISDRLPPSLAGSHAFDRHTLGIVTQARTGMAILASTTTFRNPPAARAEQNYRHANK
jgi:hypothetical protein